MNDLFVHLGKSVLQIIIQFFIFAWFRLFVERNPYPFFLLHNLTTEFIVHKLRIIHLLVCCTWKYYNFSN